MGGTEGGGCGTAKTELKPRTTLQTTKYSFDVMSRSCYTKSL